MAICITVKAIKTPTKLMGKKIRELHTVTLQATEQEQINKLIEKHFAFLSTAILCKKLIGRI